MTSLALILLMLLPQIAVDGSQDFEALKRQALAMEESTDFFALRLAFTDTRGYDPLFSLSDTFRGALGAVTKGSPQTVLEVCSDTTPAFIISITFHQACASRLADLGEHDDARLHRFMADGLLASLTPDDNGEILIVELEEQYSLVESNNCKVVMHATVAPRNRGDPPLSGLEVVDEQGDTHFFVFRKHAAYERFQRGLLKEGLDGTTE